MKARFYLAIAAISIGAYEAGFAQTSSATTPVTPAQFVAQETPSNTGALTLQGGQLTPPPNLMQLLEACNKPEAMIFDSNKSGKVDTLRVYGVNRIDPQLWTLRGPSTLGPATTKAELQAKAFAAEFLNGVAIFQQQIAQSSDTTTSSAATSGSAAGAAAATSLLSEVRDSLVSITQSTVQGFLRNGRVSGTRLVSLGTYGMCVVARYDLPLDQRVTSPVTPTTPPAPSVPTTPPAPSVPTFPPLPPGQSGGF